jgi:pyruvate dehydrogenase E2 component (dihydrolipoamide acetyltransferase)
MGGTQRPSAFGNEDRKKAAMAVAIRLPDMGTNVEECKILSWRIKPGEAVKRGDILADIETDKAVAELESTGEGVLLQVVIKERDLARTGDILAYVGMPGESLPDEAKAVAAPAAGLPQGTASPVAILSHLEGGRTLHVAPIVRNLAAKLDIDLGRVKGTGAGGVITREDVQRASREAARKPLQTTPLGEALPRAQVAVARAVQKSWKEIPHLSITASIDMTSAQEMRAKGEINGARLSYDAIFLKAMARAAETLPMVACKLDGDQIIRPQGIHIALAIGLDNELFLPVVRDVEKKDLVDLQKEVALLLGKVKGRTLGADQMSGGSMALSNLGMYPIEAFDGIIFPEHSTILTVGATQLKPVVLEGEVRARPLVTVKLAVDHRLINGRTGAAFLSKVKEVIESGEIF